MCLGPDHYRPRSEGYVFTGVCHSVIFGGEGGVVTWDLVTTPPSLPSWSQHPPPSRSQHPPWDLVTTPRPPPQDLDQGPGHNTPLPPPQDYTQAGGTHPTGMHSC